MLFGKLKLPSFLRLKCFFVLLGDALGISKLNIILLGGRNCGKNFLGNLILGKEEFVTKESTSSSRRLGVVAGHWLTVVDTPGWWCDSSAQETSNLVKREIITSVSLCSPGPHVFFITVKASSVFSERRRRAMEEHVTLLGDRVWGHCIVIFTFDYRFQHTQAVECVASGGKALRWLTDKCGQRCHSVVLNDEEDVPELLVKIQKLLEENGGRVFEIQENILQVTVEEKRGVAERAQLRFLRMKRQRSLMRGESESQKSRKTLLFNIGFTFSCNFHSLSCDVNFSLLFLTYFNSHTSILVHRNFPGGLI